MATADKVLSILELFTIEKPEWTVDAVATTLDLSGSTAYQYVRSLVNAGLLVQSKGGRYMVGPAVIELDRLMRHCDPLIHRAQGPLRDLVAAVQGEAVGLLCRIYRLRVMCVDQYLARAPDASISYERGRPMPLSRGAASKVILANLSARTLRRLYDADPAGLKAEGFGGSWEEFKREIRKLRKVEALATVGELDPGMMGISAAVFDTDGDVLGSIGVVVVAAAYKNDEARIVAVKTAVAEAGAAVTRALREG
ncbi:helix-turn-helix domain-containing protein (plasmid) [Methylobacterium currus]|uniref:IclR family transcriptional regulator n=1 Tax=Methylobacterium currus TaxID=2051553 RepID=UPI001E50E3FA|nr:IclR family transcriptional regulator C-terminal domain-containing protein [Methylobacterium currus]UHC20177.1 helix-turn-helix domain-containing protein [Methylobacterium currus]